MLRFIRLHPWRLEIVPAVALVVAVGYVAYFHVTGAAAAMRRAAYPETWPAQYETSTMTYVGMLAFFWVIAAMANHRWVLLEPRKMYNWTALLFQATILGYTGITVFLVRIGIPQLDPTTLDLYFDAIPVIVLAGATVTAVLEWTRRFVPKDFADEPDPPPSTEVCSDGGFRYVETGMEWEWMIFGAGALTAGIADAAHGWLTDGSVWVLAGALLCSMSRRKVEASSHCVAMWNGLYKRQIALSDAALCRAVPDYNGQRPREISRRKWHQISWNTGRCLEITTKQGEIYRFGMLRPQYACSLIESVIGVERTGG